jgi:hypothetical protein
MPLKDFINRKYDYLAFQPAADRRDGLKDLALYDERSSGKICTGAQKLAQRWALEFLTERGSMPYLPARGCDFMTQIRQGRVRTQNDIIANFTSASLAITRNLRQEEYEGMPDEERFDRALLANVILHPGYADLRVIIVSRAGINRTVIFPIETLPQVS